MGKEDFINNPEIEALKGIEGVEESQFLSQAEKDELQNNQGEGEGQGGEEPIKPNEENVNQNQGGEPIIKEKQEECILEWEKIMVSG